nr:hypothetical protein GCM10010200_081970 [Actinomadura rugatobispora]
MVAQGATDEAAPALRTRSAPQVFVGGVVVWLSGGPEFRLPLLIGLSGFAELSAVIVNKGMSLIVVWSHCPPVFGR